MDDNTVINANVTDLNSAEAREVQARAVAVLGSGGPAHHLGRYV